MHHSDEQLLAFYAMGVDLPLPERVAVEDHLRSCAGCRAQVEELQEINRFVEERTAAADPDPVHTIEALERIPRPPARHFNAPPARIPLRLVTRIQRTAGIMRRHPISTGSGILLLGLLSFATIREVGTRKHAAEQPIAIRMNGVESALEVMGDQNTKLWEIPIDPKNRSADGNNMDLNFNTRISDLDDDGNMEVITGSHHVDGQGRMSSALRVFTHDGHLLHSWTLGSRSTFDGSSYAKSFAVAGVLVLTPTGTQGKEIFVSLANDRSPSCLVRLTPEGEVLGEYWHFGWMLTPLMVRLNGEDRQFILLTGVNDVGYQRNQVFPSLVILDPTSIVGRTESQQTRGFGFSESSAEVYYIAAGNADRRLISDSLTYRPGFTYGAKIAQDNSFTVAGSFALPEGFPKVMYTFDDALSLRDVWFSDADRLILTDRFLTRKTPEGQTEFVRDLRSKVRWWDGTTWQDRPAKIRYAGPAR